MLKSTATLNKKPRLAVYEKPALFIERVSGSIVLSHGHVGAGAFDGTVVYSAHRSTMKLGQHGIGWERKKFDDYEGEVVIRTKL